MTGVVPPASGGPTPPRKFTDPEGRRWTVTEEQIPRADWTSADLDHHRAGYGVGWLQFACAARRKRLRLFPADWQGLSDAELDRLCRRALEMPPS